MNLSLEEAQAALKQVQNRFMRGELDPYMLMRLKEARPDVIAIWTLKKLNLKVRIKKFRKRVNDQLRNGLNNGNGKKSRLVKKVYKTQKKQIDKIQRQYIKSGCRAVLSFANLTKEVLASLGVGGLA